MTETADSRVAVYIDFDNIVISRYNQLHGGGKSAQKVKDLNPTDENTAKRLREATVDIGAILDYASTFGSIVLGRAYADWSVPVNASYRKQLIDRAVDLVQLFPTVASMKNGADIRLAVDVVEDLFSLSYVTHVVLVAGDSDYIALAQRSRRLGRYVVGIGVAGSTSASLAAACDEFTDYDDIPGVGDEIDDLADPAAESEPQTAANSTISPASLTAAKGTPKKQAPEASAAPEKLGGGKSQKGASRLLLRALQLLHSKEDSEWLHGTTVKNQILRMDPTFSEKALGYPSFTDFVKSRPNMVEIDDSSAVRKLRIHPKFDGNAK